MGEWRGGNLLRRDGAEGRIRRTQRGPWRQSAPRVKVREWNWPTRKERTLEDEEDKERKRPRKGSAREGGLIGRGGYPGGVPGQPPEEGKEHRHPRWGERAPGPSKKARSYTLGTAIESAWLEPCGRPWMVYLSLSLDLQIFSLQVTQALADPIWSSIPYNNIVLLVP